MKVICRQNKLHQIVKRFRSSRHKRVHPDALWLVSVFPCHFAMPELTVSRNTAPSALRTGPKYRSVTGTFAPRNIRSRERKLHLWNFRSQKGKKLELMLVIVSYRKCNAFFSISGHRCRPVASVLYRFMLSMLSMLGYICGISENFVRFLGCNVRGLDSRVL